MTIVSSQPEIVENEGLLSTSDHSLTLNYGAIATSLRVTLGDGFSE